MRLIILGFVIFLSGCATQLPDVVAEKGVNTSIAEYPQPKSWSFPEIVKSAREISPTNLEGRPFNQFGLAYSKEVLQGLDISSMSAEALQNYADVVTHAYPDAIALQIPISCKYLSLNDLNETSIAGMAFLPHLTQ